MSPGEQTRIHQLPKKGKVAEWIGITILAILCLAFTVSMIHHWIQ